MVDGLKLKIWRSRVAQRLFGRKVEIAKSWAETPGSYTDMVQFLDWFDRTTSIDDTLRRSEVDWKYRFAESDAYRSVPHGTAMEIGFGGGRLLLQAAKEFRQVIGVDIHTNFPMTERFLQSQGCTNYRLVHRDQLAGVASGSVDFLYSFIVFQHFDTLAEVEFYLDHIARLLSPQGVAQIYYGKKSGEGVDVTTADAFRLRDCSLFIAPGTMRDIVAARFDLIAYEDSLPRDPVAKTGESVQAMVMFRNRSRA